MGIPIANAVTFSEAPDGTERAFNAVSQYIGAARVQGVYNPDHLAKAAKEKKA
jgi:hypothetical protein